MSGEFQVCGDNSSALFTLKIHRGDGMALLAMDWKKGKPPDSFVGFAIEYKEPKGDRFYTLKNRIWFPGADPKKDPNCRVTLRSPIQKFRWFHFPRNANKDGEFTYRVTPVFMNKSDELSYGEAQIVSIELRRDTYPDQLNVAYTRGFLSSQTFVDKYESAGAVDTLLPGKAEEGLVFKSTHPMAKEAKEWLGFEALEILLDLLDRAFGDKKAQVRVVAYDLNEPEVVAKLEKLGSRLKIIIDDEGAHGKTGSAENQAQVRLEASAGKGNVKRQHMGGLQHNKTIVVEGPKVKAVLCGSTNFSWRGLYVQANNALVMEGGKAIQPFLAAFDNYWLNDDAGGFAKTPSSEWTDLGLEGIKAKVAFSPHSKSNTLLQTIADDIADNTQSSLLYSLAFLYQTKGAIRNAIAKVTADDKKFVYGISDRKVDGLDVQKPDGNHAPVYPASLSKGVPEPFKPEPTGGGGIRMHHKFVVIDFNTPDARVYLGSYNFSGAADTQNGENLLLIRDKRVAVSYAVEAMSLFDHYHFRLNEQEAEKERKKKKEKAKKLELKKPPCLPGEKPWWDEDYTDARKKRDRELFR
jgi:phosphatidylserine/phosphatidylglycerophosphate/cardiolipin synthase-like enzyme